MNKIYNIIFLLFVIFGMHQRVYGQGATCGTAAALTLTGACGTNSYSFTSTTVQNTTCQNPTEAGWYTFTPSFNGSVTLTMTTTTVRDISIAAFTGACGSLVEVACADFTLVGFTETLTFTVTAGTPYRIELMRNAGTGAPANTGNICAVFTPANNNCATATSLISSGTCSTTSGSTIGATQSQVACTGTADDDVWYSFVAEVSTHTVTVTPSVASGLSDVVVEVFSGTCGSLTSLSCVNTTSGSSAETVNLTGLLAGTTYFVRVHSQANTTGQGNFTICITHPTPANDNCANAIPLTLGAFCTSGTIAAATNAAPNGTGGCGSGNRTVWYRFTANATSQVVSLDNFSAANLNFEVYSGTCGGTLTSLICRNGGGAGVDEIATVTGLTAGQTYLVRVNGNGAADIGDFCIQAYSVIPPNDDCSLATPLTINAPCQNGSINNATNTGVNGAVCGASSDTRTVWYSFVATQASHFVKLQNDTNNDLDVAIFSGTCAGVLTQIACLDAGGDGGDEGAAVTVVSGQTYLVRVGNVIAAGVGNFCINVYGNAPNNDCSNAQTLTVDGACTNGNNYMATNTGTNPAATCINNTLSVWYSFVATQSTHIIELDPAVGEGDIGIALFSSSNQTCSGTYTQLFCQESGGTSARAGRETMVATGLTAGIRYFIMVSGESATGRARFCIRVRNPPVNDACANAIVLTPGASSCTTGTTNAATNDAGIADASCLDDDNSVWYTFTATRTTHTITLTNGSPSLGGAFNSNIGFAVFTGACGGGLTQIACEQSNGDGENERRTFNTTPGTTYRIMVDFTNNNTGNFCIAVLNPPVNDQICNATDLTINFSCTSGNLLGATNSAGDPTISCGNNTRTIWYKFTASATSHNLATMNISTAGNANIVMQTFSSSNNTCSGTLTSLGCINANTDYEGENTTLTGLTIGNTYFVAVAGQAANDIAELCISVNTANDICSNAVALATNASCVAGGNTGTSTTAATDNISTCQTPQRTVWYTFVATSSTATVIVTPSADFNAEINVFSASASCSGLTELACVDDVGDGGVERANLSALTVGATYYVMVDGDGGAQGTFCINVTVPIVCGTNPPPADGCVSAPLISNINGYCGVTDFNYQRDLYNNLRDMMCFDDGTTLENNSFIKFIAASTTATIEVQIVNSSPSGGPPCDSGIQMNIFEVSGTDCTTAVWKPVTSCISPSGGAGSTRTRVATNLVPGNTYYIMFDGFAGDECGFLMRTPQGGGVLLPVVLTKFTGIRMTNYNHLQWTTSDEAGASHFIVEKSTDGLKFEQTMAVAATGNSNKIVNYEAKDTQLLPITTYYRLKIVDLDGTITYSKIISIEGSNNAKNIALHLFPNPAEQTINYQITVVESADYLLEIFNVLGYKMVTKQISLKEGQNELQENLSHLSSGIYVIKVVGNDGNVMQGRFVKQ